MNRPVPISTDLLIQHEVLRARLEIRDFFLAKIFREVYENIGQVLSVAKMQLQAKGSALFGRESDPDETTGELVGQSITRLRQMCRDFYPDAELVKDKGFEPFIGKIIRVTHPGADYLVHPGDPDNGMDNGTKLIFFNMVLQTLVGIQKAKGRVSSLAMRGTKRQLVLRVVYTGDSPWKDEPTEEGLSLAQRAELLQGSLALAKQPKGGNRLKFILPLNQNS
jgi:hypothetical protein